MISLVALLFAILVSVVFSSLNIGALAIGLSLIVGHYFGGLKVDAILKGFPTNLFILLAGTTYLFSIASANGTLEKLTAFAIRAVRGRAALLPIVLFFLAFGLSAMGPGQITTSALLAGPAMLLADQVGISPLLMALVVGNGAQAGAMSPLAPPGIISASILSKQGLTGVGGVLWLNMPIVHVAVTILAYFLFGGLKLWRSGSLQGTGAGVGAVRTFELQPFDRAPLSTTGAVFIANAGPKANKNKLFRDMLIWGLSMSVVGAIVSWLAFTV